MKKTVFAMMILAVAVVTVGSESTAVQPVAIAIVPR